MKASGSLTWMPGCSPKRHAGPRQLLRFGGDIIGPRHWPTHIDHGRRQRRGLSVPEERCARDQAKPSPVASGRGSVGGGRTDAVGKSFSQLKVAPGVALSAVSPATGRLERPANGISKADPSGGGPGLTSSTTAPARYSKGKTWQSHPSEISKAPVSGSSCNAETRVREILCQTPEVIILGLRRLEDGKAHSLRPHGRPSIRSRLGARPQGG